MQNITPWRILDEELSDLMSECRAHGFDPVDPIQFREFAVSRQRKIDRVKDRKRAKTQSRNFKKNRREYMKGIKRFHKSSKGKRFHRNLGRFLATTAQREGLTDHATPRNIVEISSAKIHLNIADEYLIPGYLEAAEFQLFREEANERLLEVLSLVENSEPLEEEDLYFLMHLVSPQTVKETMDESSPEYQASAEMYVKEFSS